MNLRKGNTFNGLLSFSIFQILTVSKQIVTDRFEEFRLTAFIF